MEQTPSRKRKRKQKIKFTKPPKVKKHVTVESDKVSDSVTSGEQEDSEAEESESAEEEEDESREDEVASDVEWEEGEAAGRDEEGEGETEDTMQGEVDENKDPHPEPVLRTDYLYHVSCCVEPLPEEPLEIQDEKEVVTGEQGKLFAVLKVWR